MNPNVLYQLDQNRYGMVLEEVKNKGISMYENFNKIFPGVDITKLVDGKTINPVIGDIDPVKALSRYAATFEGDFSYLEAWFHYFATGSFDYSTFKPSYLDDDGELEFLKCTPFREPGGSGTYIVKEMSSMAGIEVTCYQNPTILEDPDPSTKDKSVYIGKVTSTPNHNTGLNKLTVNNQMHLYRTDKLGGDPITRYAMLSIQTQNSTPLPGKNFGISLFKLGSELKDVVNNLTDGRWDDVRLIRFMIKLYDGVSYDDNKKPIACYTWLEQGPSRPDPEPDFMLPSNRNVVLDASKDYDGVGLGMGNGKYGLKNVNMSVFERMSNLSSLTGHSKESSTTLNQMYLLTGNNFTNGTNATINPHTGTLNCSGQLDHFPFNFTLFPYSQYSNPNLFAGDMNRSANISQMVYMACYL